MADSVELELPPDTQHVGLARLVVVTAARRAGMREEQVEDLRIAVSEATTNAILVHQRVATGERVRLRFGETGDGVFEVIIFDAGPGFDPDGGYDADESVDHGDDWLSEGGLGLTLIRGLADDVAFVQEGGMQVQLRYAVSPREAPEP